MKPITQGIHNTLMLVHFLPDGTRESVIAHLPEEVAISFGAVWEQNAAGKMAEGVANKVNQISSGLFGGGLGDPITTALTYKAPKHPALSITFQLNAESSSLLEVIMPIRNLIGMCTPRVAGNLKVSYPGPVAGDLLKNIFTGNGSNGLGSATGSSGNTTRDGESANTDERIMAIIGRVIKFDSIVIDDIQLKFPTAVGPDLLPLSCTVTLSIRPFTVPYRDEINKMIGGV